MTTNTSRSKLSRAARSIDAVTVQAVIAAALSFSHLMAVAEAAGQSGWQIYAYPISVDLLLIAAFRRARKYGGFNAWLWFMVALVATLAANTASVLGTDEVTLPMQLIVAGWPALALLGGTLLVHGRTGPVDEPEPIVEAPVVIPAVPNIPPAVVEPTVDEVLAPEEPTDESDEEPKRGPYLVTIREASEALDGVPESTIRGWVTTSKRITNYGKNSRGRILVDLYECREQLARV